MKKTRKYALISLCLCFVAQAQDSYVPITHPVYPFLEYLESARKLFEPLPTHRPLRKNYIIKQLHSARSAGLTNYEAKIVDYYSVQILPIERQETAKFDGPIASRGNLRNGWRNIWQYGWDTPELHLLSFQDSMMVVTFDWKQNVRTENWSGESRRIEEDGFVFAGQIGDRITWGSEMFRYREFQNDSIRVPPVEFKQAFRQSQKGGGQLPELGRDTWLHHVSVGYIPA